MCVLFINHIITKFSIESQAVLSGALARQIDQEYQKQYDMLETDIAAHENNPDSLRGPKGVPGIKGRKGETGGPGPPGGTGVAGKKGSLFLILVIFGCI